MVAASKAAQKQARGGRKAPPRQARRRPQAVFRGGLSYMTSKGQVTITANLREALGLQPGDQVKMMLQDDGSVKLEKVPDIMEVIASLPKAPGPPMTTEEMGRLAQEELARGAMRHDPRWQDNRD